MADRPPLVGYARVSTGEQLEALSTQRARLLAAGVDSIIEDVQSGREADRAGYLELLSGIQGGTIGGVLVTRLDRLGRDAAEVDGLLAFAARRGVSINAIDGGQLESQTPQGFALTRVMSTMAELESRMLSLRIRSALKARRLIGAPLRGRPPWGYRQTADHLHLEPDPVQWPRVHRFLEMLAANDWRSQTTLRQWLASDLGPIPINSVSALNNWLVNPVLRGGLGYRKKPGRDYNEVIWNQHEALLSEEQYRQIMRRKAENRRNWGKNVRYNHRLLTGLVRCGHCHQRMYYIPHRTTPSLYCHHFTCPMHYRTVHEAPLVEAIHRALCARAEDLAAAVTTEDPEAEELLRQIQRLEALNDEDLAPAIALKRQKMQELHKRPAIDQELAGQLRRPEFWAAATPEEQRELFQDLVEEVVVENLKPKQVRLRF